MALEHMVWLTPKAGVSEEKMEEILQSIRVLTHLPGVVTISAGKNITDRANSATHGVLVTLESPEYLPQYLNHSDHQAVCSWVRIPTGHYRPHGCRARSLS